MQSFMDARLFSYRFEFTEILFVHTSTENDFREALTIELGFWIANSSSSVMVTSSRGSFTNHYKSPSLPELVDHLLVR